MLTQLPSSTQNYLLVVSMIKRAWLEMIVEDIELLIEWSNMDPDAFNRVISEQEIRNLQELASNLVVRK
jgi:hypothetical protein